MRATVDGFAPTATRTPISRVRFDTEYASTPCTPINASNTAMLPTIIARMALMRSPLGT